MTKQEAKSILIYQLGFISNDISFEQQQFSRALEIAIEALEEDITMDNLLAELADKMDRVYPIPPSEIERALELARLEGKNVNI